MSTLAELLDRLRLALRDAASAEWSDAELTEHLRHALADVNRSYAPPSEKILETTPGMRTVSLAGIAGLLTVREVLYPYNPASPVYPLESPRWRLRDANTLELLVLDPPVGDGTDCAIVVAEVALTVDGLDGATSTTLDPVEEDIVLDGACGYAVEQLALSLVGQVTVGDAPARTSALAEHRLARFRSSLAARALLPRAVADPRVVWDGEV